METKKITIEGIPAIIWGKQSEKVFMHLHGKFSCKEHAKTFATIAEEYGYQTLSFDLPEHGERSANTEYKCNVINCKHDAQIIGKFVLEHWKNISVYGCSLGAQITLQTFNDKNTFNFEKVLFQSPIINMNHLIQQMFIWNGITEEQLRREKVIPTPLDTITEEQFDFFRTHPVSEWPNKTSILFGAKDNMQTRNIMEEFIQKFGGTLTVSETSEHPFMAPGDSQIFINWLRNSLE